MKICFVTSVFPRHPDDLEVPWLRILVKRLRAKGHDIRIFVPSFRGLKSHAIDGIPVKRFRYFFAPWETLTHDEGAPNKIYKLHYKIISVFYILAGTLGLIRFHAKERFDILHVHWPFPHGIFGFVARMLVRSKIVLTFYGADMLLVKKYSFVKHFLRYFIKHADSVIAISSFTGKEVKAVYDRPLHIIPYGTAIALKTDLPPHTPGHRILSVGRMIERKGFAYLINAMPRVLATYPDARLTIAGGGALHADLVSLRDSLGLQQSVDLPGKVPNETLENLFASCDVFVLPSIIDSKGDTEGLGVVILEALTYSKPVIATEIGGIVDIVQHNKTGLLVPQKDPQALADAICAILSDPARSKALVAKGIRHIREHFSWENIVATYLSLYDSTLKSSTETDARSA
jgi:glycosyltransferase involved in cell wall biosynthesis